MTALTTAQIVAMVFALIRNAPALVSFLSSLASHAEREKGKGLGYDAAVGDGLRRSQLGLDAAKAATAEAEKRHKAKPGDDSVFDQRFRED